MKKLFRIGLHGLPPTAVTLQSHAETASARHVGPSPMEPFFSINGIGAALALVPVAQADGIPLWLWGVIGLVIFAAMALLACSWALNSKARRQTAEWRANEERYTLVFATAGDAMFLLDQGSGTILESNEAAAALYGYSHDEFRQLKNTDLSAEPDKTSSAIRQELQVAPLRYHRKKDGTVFPVEIKATYYDQNGERVSVVNIRDITEREQTQHALRESEARYRQLFDNMTSGFALHEMIRDEKGNPIDYRYIQVNPGFEKLTGLAAERVVGRTVRELLPEIEPAWINQFGRVEETGEPAIIEDYSQDLNKHFETRAFRPAPGQFAVIFHDVSDRKHAEQVLAASEAKYRELFEHSADAFLIIQEGRFTDCNMAAVDMLGYSAKEDVIGKSPGDLSPTTQPDGLDSGKKAQDMLAAMETSQSLRFEWHHKKANGEVFPVAVTLTALTDNEGRPMIHTAWRNITARKQMEEALEKRIVALTRPLDDDAEIAFDDLFSRDAIQRIQDGFAAATGVASIITHPDGTPITEPSNFTSLCYDIIRKTEKGRANCHKSDAELGRHHQEGPIVQCCLSGGLWDAGASIEVGGRHIANWLIGQVRDESQSDEDMRRYAREIGADEDAFMDAFHRVPVMPRERFTKVADVLFTLANQLSATAYQNIQQARFIAAQKKAEQTLKDLAEVQGLILDNSTVGIALLENRTFKWVNPRMSELFNIPEQELQGASTRLLYASEEDFLENGAKAYAVLEQGNRFEHTLQFQRGDGSLFWCRLIGSALDPKSPLESGSLWMFEDISERRASENELLRLSTAIEQSPETVVITDLEGRIQYVNPAFERASGFAREEVLGMNPNMLSSGEHDEAYYADLWDTIASGGIWEGRIVNRRKIGTLYTEEASIAPVKDATGTITNYVAVKRDISEELIREEELRQAQKMDAVGQLAGGIAHDFNNILQGIMGFSEMLQMELDAQSPEYDGAVEIHKAAKRAAQLTRQLLTFSRKQPSHFETVDLNNTVHDALALLNMLLGEKYDIVLDLQQQLPPIHADPGQLTQVIINLAVNARDAMPEGGRLTISTDSGTFQPEDAALIPEAQAGSFVCLSITDTGCGMDKDTKKRLFEPFFTTKEVGEGTGLGLSVVYGIAQQSKGWVNVYSETGKGSCFKIYFPAIAASPASPEEPAHRHQAHGRATILLVEDDPELATMGMEILLNAGHDPILAISAEEAMEHFRDVDGNIDLLVSDMELPGLRGDELADELRKRNPALPVLLLSGYRDQHVRWQHLEDRDYLFMNKPFTISNLTAMVGKLIQEYKGEGV
ncbi:Sensor kinase CckA [Pontiella desulfatans]|uniref:histidine kinase n=1 Tax=Pontiella desulfatans TaxID=2750659 RepID=A0A6C2UD55_PONDE|nr:PAS domain S-box protein [Pontiella desulfatans]VGO17146.1 Sensor kinase CckA [Pontiella desulfatans]